MDAAAEARSSSDSAMTAHPLFTVLPTIFRELVLGSPDPAARTYVLNRGDHGLLAALEQLSAARASAAEAGGASIAAHVDHLRYGFAILNRWAKGALPSKREVDWTASWRKLVVTEPEWRTSRDELRREAEAWCEALATPRDLSEIEAGWLAGSVAHVAYHLGSIRQLDRMTRGPTAEDEARVEAALPDR
jgi:hypothetical protein